MPLHRRQPRPYSIRLHHTSLEIRKLLMAIGNMADLIRMIRNLPSLPSHKTKRLTLLLQMSMASTVFLTHIPRLTDDTAIPRKGPTAFEEIQFKDHFRFRKQDFYRVLCALHLTVSPNNPTPRILHIGRPKTQSTVSSDWAFMVLLKRLSSACQYRQSASPPGASLYRLHVPPIL